MIRVLIAEDSLVVQKTLVALLSEEPGIEVVGIAHTGVEAVEMFRRLRPDLVTMDIFMPEMDGLEATRLLLSRYPARIVIISSAVDSTKLSTSFEAIGDGAVDIIEKPHGVLSGDYSEIKRILVKRIREIASSTPENHLAWIASPAFRKPTGEMSIPPEYRAKAIKSPAPSKPTEPFFPRLIAVGGSTGAPAVIEAILSQLPSGYPIPVVVAQHISKGFVEGMALWLNRTINLQVKVAAPGDLLAPGRVLIAPDRAHLEINSDNSVNIREPAKEDIHVPSIDKLFHSVAEAYRNQSVGIVLSGMGKDGTKGLLEMRKAGATTIAQSKGSALIYGMPGVATSTGAAREEMSPSEIVEFLRGFESADSAV
jgi:two-component system chemotaxis response regulator CheB